LVIADLSAEAVSEKNEEHVGDGDFRPRKEKKQSGLNRTLDEGGGGKLWVAGRDQETSNKGAWKLISIRFAYGLANGDRARGKIPL